MDMNMESSTLSYSPKMDETKETMPFLPMQTKTTTPRLVKRQERKLRVSLVATNLEPEWNKSSVVITPPRLPRKISLVSTTEEPDWNPQVPSTYHSPQLSRDRNHEPENVQESVGSHSPMSPRGYSLRLDNSPPPPPPPPLRLILPNNQSAILKDLAISAATTVEPDWLSDDEKTDIFSDEQDDYDGAKAQAIRDGHMARHLSEERISGSPRQRQEKTATKRVTIKIADTSKSSGSTIVRHDDGSVDNAFNMKQQARQSRMAARQIIKNKAINQATPNAEEPREQGIINRDLGNKRNSVKKKGSNEPSLTDSSIPGAFPISNTSFGSAQIENESNGFQYQQGQSTSENRNSNNAKGLQLAANGSEISNGRIGHIERQQAILTSRIESSKSLQEDLSDRTYTQSNDSIEAYLVNENQPDHSEVVSAVKISMRRRLLVFTLLTILVVGVAVGVAFTVIASLGGQQQNSVIPSASPSASPTLSSDFLLTFLQDVSLVDESTFQDSSSPQWRAFLWLDGNRRLFDNLPLSRLIQKFALAVFYYALRGDTWLNKDGWLVEENECEWYSSDGSLCNEAGEIVSLNLQFNILRGSLNPDIGLLTKLALLDLHANQISGSLPTEIGRLTNLRTFVIAENSLMGSIPSAFGNLTSLFSILMGKNVLTGTLPPSLFSLTALNFLFLSDNELSGTIPDVGNATELKVFNLERNLFVGTIPRTIGNLEQMLSLSLQDNELTGTLPPSLSNLRQISDLSFGSNDLEGPIPAMSFDSLKRLDLGSNRLTGSIQSTLFQLPNMEILDLQNNLLSATLPDVMAAPKLQILRLGYNIIRGTIPTSIGNTTSLTSFTLEENKLEGRIPSEIGMLTNMKELFLAENLIDGSLPSEMGQLTRLKIVRVSDNGLSGSIPTSFQALERLVVLDVHNNRISGSIPQMLAEFDNLRELLLQSNRFHGTIPSILGALKNLVGLGLSENNLSGVVPSELAKCTKLRKVLLNDNPIEGLIPSEFSDWKSLIQFQVHNTNLQGRMPASICSLFNRSLADLTANCAVLSCPCCTACCDSGLCQPRLSR